jgi:excinuclease ABC subunit C
MKKDFSTMVSRVSDFPGVYLMKDETGAVIYIGKAYNLKKRVASYFEHRNHKDPKTTILIERIASFETMVTATEQEALILEATLIQRYKPRYNVILKDDKRYPSLRLEIQNPYPNIQLVRKIRRDESLYFGPYTSSTALHQTLRFIHKNFKLRKCKSPVVRRRHRPCLNYQMGVCLAPCCFEIDSQKYSDIVNEVRLFLEGRTRTLIQKIRKDMLAAAENEDFEKAANLRDKLFSFEKIFEKQVAVTNDFMDRDVISIARDNQYALVVALIVREGSIQGIHQYSISDVISSDSEIIAAFLRHFYAFSRDIPDEIIIPTFLEEAGFYEKWLADLGRKKIHILTPRRGDKAKLLDMAFKNAENRLLDMAAELKDQSDLLVRVQRNLKLIKYPRRIECFDISGIFGKQLVAGQVVYIDGRPAKTSYRRYSIKTVNIQDDYASMVEILNRRFKARGTADSFPDLLMIDGGKGQLNIAVSILKKLCLNQRLDIISIAKGDKKRGEIHDKIYKPDRLNPIKLTGRGDVLLFLQQVRDEAHRYSITFHRGKRSKALMQSVLDGIPGIGRKRKMLLLNQFSSINAIRKASTDELTKLPGMNNAVVNSIREALSKTA